MDLGDIWEKKALIALAVITIIIVIYAYNPFEPTPDVKIQNDTVPTSPPQDNSSFNLTKSNNTTANNTTIEDNATTPISKEDAKKKASQSGYEVGDPKLGIIKINNTEYTAWIVPILKDNKIVKEIYIDAITGKIIGSKEESTIQL